MGFMSTISQLLMFATICVLVLMLIKRKSESSALKEEISTKNVEITILNKRIEDLTQANTAFEQRLSDFASYQQIADVDAWVSATKAQMQNYIDEVNRYAQTIVANAEAEAARIAGGTTTDNTPHP